MKRRDFLSRILGFLIFLISGKLIWDFLSFSLKKRQKLSIPIAQVGTKPSVIDGIIVWRENDTYRVYSSHCTHLGCILKYDQKAGIFKCPCHGSEFAINGTVIHGPARKNLKSLDYIVKNDKIEVNL